MLGIGKEGRISGMEQEFYQSPKSQPDTDKDNNTALYSTLLTAQSGIRH